MPRMHAKDSAPSSKEINQLNALFDSGQHVILETFAGLLLEQYPNSGVIWKVLGVSLKIQGKDALPALRRATELLPDDASAHSNLGVALTHLGRLDEALASLRRALNIKPDFAAAHINLGNVLKDLGRLNDAVASYRKALRIEPNQALVHYNLGVCLHGVGQYHDAVASYQRAIEIKPDYAQAHSNMGAILHELGQVDKAVASYRQAMKIEPDLAEAHSNLGNVLKDLGQLDDAIASYHRALEIRPDFVGARNNLLFTLNYHPDKSGEEIFAAYQEFNAKIGLTYRQEWRPYNNSRECKRRLKVGYVSPDFRLHPVRHVLEPLLAHHNKSEVEIYAYADLTVEDAVTQRYKAYVDHWVPTIGLIDAALADRIRADGVDILVDLAGHTGGNRLNVFARKPAPVSLSWLGYGYTTGLTAIDYLLTDSVIAPIGSEGLFSESPWRLAYPSFVYRPDEAMGPLNSLPAEQLGYLTFGLLSRSIRMNYRTIRVWSEILKRVKNSRLVIDSGSFKDEAMQSLFAAKFAAHGIDRDRLKIGFHSPPWDVLRELDVGLDCFPHNSGTTLAEFLYMGVPFVTLAGRPSVGRIGSLTLEGAGHPEWIAQTEEEYVEKAVALASDLPKLAALRTKLREDMKARPIMDEPGFARKVEQAYREMFRIWSEKEQ